MLMFKEGDVIYNKDGVAVASFTTDVYMGDATRLSLFKPLNGTKLFNGKLITGWYATRVNGSKYIF